MIQLAAMILVFRGLLRNRKQMRRHKSWLSLLEPNRGGVLKLRGGGEDFMLSQSNPDKERFEHMVDPDREDLLDYEDSLEKEKLEMEKLEAHFEERTSKLASNMMSLRDEGDLMDADKQLEGEEEIMADG
jgi:hypothetical protein